MAQNSILFCAIFQWPMIDLTFVISRTGIFSFLSAHQAKSFSCFAILKEKYFSIKYLL